MPKHFQYDVFELIEGVKDHPCIWDRSLDCYKDRLERRSAWEAIFQMLERRYEDLTSEEKRILEETVISKWTNLRDTFVKSLKNRPGKPKKRYFYHDFLKFLIPVVIDQEGTSVQYEGTYNAEETPLVIYKQEAEGSDGSRASVRAETDSEDYEPKPKKTRSNKRVTRRKEPEYEKPDLYEVENEIDVTDFNGSDVRVMNEDEAFFASLLPTIVKYNEDERLEFRIEVLAVMRKIRERNKEIITSSYGH